MNLKFRNQLRMVSGLLVLHALMGCQENDSMSAIYISSETDSNDIENCLRQMDLATDAGEPINVVGLYSLNTQSISTVQFKVGMSNYPQAPVVFRASQIGEDAVAAVKANDYDSGSTTGRIYPKLSKEINAVIRQNTGGKHVLFSLDSSDGKVDQPKGLRVNNLAFFHGDWLITTFVDSSVTNEQYDRIKTAARYALTEILGGIKKCRQ